MLTVFDQCIVQCRPTIPTKHLHRRSRIHPVCIYHKPNSHARTRTDTDHRRTLIWHDEIFDRSIGKYRSLFHVSSFGTTRFIIHDLQLRFLYLNYEASPIPSPPLYRRYFLIYACTRATGSEVPILSTQTRCVLLVFASAPRRLRHERN